MNRSFKKVALITCSVITSLTISSIARSTPDNAPQFISAEHSTTSYPVGMQPFANPEAFDYETSTDYVTDPVVLSEDEDPVNHVRFDQDGDGMADILLRNTETGDNAIFIMDGDVIEEAEDLDNISLDWEIVGRGDFDGDGKSDILWRHKTNGRNYIWLMYGSYLLLKKEIAYFPQGDWKIHTVDDFDGDGQADIFWHNQKTGKTYLWLMDGTVVKGYLPTGSVTDLRWKIAASGDFNKDGHADLIWHHSKTGKYYIWLMEGGIVNKHGYSKYWGAPFEKSWQIVGTGDIDGDGDDDLFFENTENGYLTSLRMEDSDVDLTKNPVILINDALQVHKVVTIADFNGDGTVEVLYSHPENSGDFYLRNITFDRYGTVGGGVTKMDTEEGLDGPIPSSWQVIAN
jgi:hypothetical protein